MKTLRSTLALLLGVAALVEVQAAPSPASSPARVEVNFENPDKFTDAADAPRGSDFGREQNLGELRDYIVKRASAVLPPDQRLSVTITDVDLAGEIEPWRTGGAQDVRIIKEVYVPRIELSYRVTDGTGAVVKEGQRALRDLTFTMRLHVNRNDPRVYEKELLDDWIRSDLRQKK